MQTFHTVHSAARHAENECEPARAALSAAAFKPRCHACSVALKSDGLPSLWFHLNTCLPALRADAAVLDLPEEGVGANAVRQMIAAMVLEGTTKEERPRPQVMVAVRGEAKKKRGRPRKRPLDDKKVSSYEHDADFKVVQRTPNNRPNQVAALRL